MINVWTSLIFLWFQGLSILDREPLLIGISLSTPEKVFRVVDIGPNAENKEEVFEFYGWNRSNFFSLDKVLILHTFCVRLSGFESSGGRRQNFGGIKMVLLQKA